MTERFLRYVAFDTQSDESSSACPSTAKQLLLAQHIADELRSIGLTSVHLDEHGYLYATLPSNTSKPVPTIGFIAHMDTSPDCSGKGVRPRIVSNYDGSDIWLNDTVCTSVSLFPELLRHVGEDLIVTDGTTLLGADDKAGIAEIVTAMEWFVAHPEVEHGEVRIAFTPDEEIGRGADLFDVEAFACQWAYTMDGGEVGELEYENFNAASATVVIAGRNVHPGYAKGKMRNAALVAAEYVNALPNERPENTEGREGFYHLTHMTATVEEARLHYILRDHDAERLEERKATMRSLAERLGATIETADQYRNMLCMLEGKPHVTDIARQAIEEACGECTVRPIRGGTDGAQLSFRGLPCPNIFAGGLFFHGRHETVSIQSMQRAVETIKNIVCLTQKRA